MQVCEDLKIQSQNDTVKLEEAKGMVYLKGFNEGVMTAGRYAGDRVADAKPKMRQDLLDSGDGIKYAEPERRVMSRSGDECIVALTDQWCDLPCCSAPPVIMVAALVDTRGPTSAALCLARQAQAPELRQAVALPDRHDATSCCWKREQMCRM